MAVLIKYRRAEIEMLPEEVYFYLPMEIKNPFADCTIEVMNGSLTCEGFNALVESMCLRLDAKLFEDSVKRVIRNNEASA